jgi:hypothetical protein
MYVLWKVKLARAGQLYAARKLLVGRIVVDPVNVLAESRVLAEDRHVDKPRDVQNAHGGDTEVRNAEAHESKEQKENPPSSYRIQKAKISGNVSSNPLYIDIVTCIEGVVIAIQDFISMRFEATVVL